MSHVHAHRLVPVVAGSLLLAAVGLTAATQAAPPESALAGWPRQTNGDGTETIAEVAVGSGNDVYVVGTTSVALPGEAPVGMVDAFLARYDKLGKLMWVTQFGTTVDDGSFLSLAVSGSSIYVAGDTQGGFPGQTDTGGLDGFVARFDNKGVMKWVRQFGTDLYDTAQDLAVSGSDVFAVGTTEGVFPGNEGGGIDGFAARFSTSGALKSVKQFGTPQEDNANSVAIGGNDLYIGGITLGDLGGSGVDPDGDVFVMRTDKAGNRKAVRQFGSTANDSLTNVAVRGSEVYAIGSTLGTLPGQSPSGSTDAFLARLNKSLAIVWTRQFGSGSSDAAQDVVVGPSAVYLVGTTFGAVGQFPNLGALDTFLIRYNTDGTVRWTRQFGTAFQDGGSGIALRSSDNYGGAVVVAGGTLGQVWGQFDAPLLDGFVATFPK